MTAPRNPSDTAASRPTSRGAPGDRLARAMYDVLAAGGAADRHLVLEALRRRLQPHRATGRQQAMLDALAGCEAAIGHAPSRREWDRWRAQQPRPQDLPSATAIRNVFGGSWSRARGRRRHAHPGRPGPPASRGRRAVHRRRAARCTEPGGLRAGCEWPDGRGLCPLDTDRAAGGRPHAAQRQALSRSLGLVACRRRGGPPRRPVRRPTAQPELGPALHLGGDASRPAGRPRSRGGNRLRGVRQLGKRTSRPRCSASARVDDFPPLRVLVVGARIGRPARRRDAGKTPRAIWYPADRRAARRLADRGPITVRPRAHPADVRRLAIKVDRAPTAVSTGPAQRRDYSSATGRLASRACPCGSSAGARRCSGRSRRRRLRPFKDR